jgi:glycosyltransferase involved in cell wall biosynthesis
VLEGYFSGWKTWAFLATERGLARMSDALVAVSPAVRDELLALGIGRPRQWRVIPVGLDLHDLLTQEVNREKARGAFGLPETGPVVGIVGRLVPIKDHVTFLDAAARVARERPDATFVVAGGGELRSELEVRARHILGDRCRFLGWVMDLPTLYGALDVVVLTSRNEGTPVALIEAGAAGKPAVATRVGGVADAVQDGKTGLLVPPGDPRAIAAGVSALLDDPSRARAFGEAARREASSKFRIERLADDLAGLYGELLARKRFPPPS